MAAGHPIVIGYRHIKDAPALFCRHFPVCIEGAAKRGIRKLQRAHQYNVAHHNQRMSRALYHKGGMDQGVPMGRERADTRLERDILIEGLKFTSLDVRLE